MSSAYFRHEQDGQDKEDIDSQFYPGCKISIPEGFKRTQDGSFQSIPVSRRGDFKQNTEKPSEE